MRDVRIFPIFEGANDVMRAFIALSGMKPLGDELKEVGGLELSDPMGSIGVLADYVTSRVKREVMPDKVTMAHEAISNLAEPLTDQVKRLRGATESLLREHRESIVERQFQQKRLADAVADIYAQIAVLSRVTAHLAEHDVEVSGQELYIAETFCTRAAERVEHQLQHVEENDDDRMGSIASSR
ncbi:MAG TPA: hypothetical protein VKB17_01015 [Thermoleophilaceae bacterium]|nr:hypothetical protein [Thermoleophilaceae bacterium]